MKNTLHTGLDLLQCLTAGLDLLPERILQGIGIRETDRQETQYILIGYGFIGWFPNCSQNGGLIFFRSNRFPGDQLRQRSSSLCMAWKGFEVGTCDGNARVSQLVF